MSRIAKKGSAQAQIAAMVRRIARKFRPEQIILFGSHARGEAGPDSDVDLLVVMPYKGCVRDKRLQIRHALRDFLVPLDIVVTSPEDFAWRKDYVGTIEYPAAREGKVVYWKKTCPALQRGHAITPQALPSSRASSWPTCPRG